MSEYERKWIDIILGLYSDLPLSNGVSRRTNGSDKKRKRIMDYFQKIEEIYNMCFIKRNTAFEKHVRSIFFFKNYIIKKENIPDSFYNSQYKYDLENGIIRNQTFDEYKEELSTKVINDQKNTLKNWIDYFIHGNGRFFPMYEKFWAFSGLQKLGKYDSETGFFSKRNKNTVYPFPSLNEAALEMTIVLMEKFVKTGEIIEGLEDAFNSYNFKLLYEYFLNEVLKKQSFRCNEGIWKKYNMNSDYTILVNDVRGKYTGWCTDRDSRAKDYLSSSDIYVFYTKDNYGNYSDPRITIRAIGKNVVEISGIVTHQNLEYEMVDALEEKLKDFDKSLVNDEKISNLRKLGIVKEKNNNDVELSIDELRFLYEVDDLIVDFGGDKNPDIYDIISSRNIRKDLSMIFGVDESEIALDISQLNNDTKIFYGNLFYNYDSSDNIILSFDEFEDGVVVSNIIVPKYILGDFSLKRYSGDYNLPSLVTGSMHLFCDKNLKRLELPDVKTSMTIYGPKKFDEIIFSDNPCYNMFFTDLEECNNVKFPSLIKGSLNLGKLVHAENVVFPLEVRNNVNLSRLITAYNVIFPKVVDGNFNIERLCIFHGEMPDFVGGKFISFNFSNKSDDARKVR